MILILPPSSESIREQFGSGLAPLSGLCPRKFQIRFSLHCWKPSGKTCVLNKDFPDIWDVREPFPSRLPWTSHPYCMILGGRGSNWSSTIRVHTWRCVGSNQFGGAGLLCIECTKPFEFYVSLVVRMCWTSLPITCFAQPCCYFSLRLIVLLYLSFWLIDCCWLAPVGLPLVRKRVGNYECYC